MYIKIKGKIGNMTLDEEIEIRDTLAKLGYKFDILEEGDPALLAERILGPSQPFYGYGKDR